MRIVIETEDRTAAASVQPQMPFDRSTASDAGPPAASLLEAVGAAAAAGDGESALREGMDGGEPPPELLAAIQAAEAPTRAATGLYVVDGGAAPRD
jgi:hypothetical protein